MTKKIIGIIASLIGIGVAIYLSYLHGTIYEDNQGLIACACFVGFCSAYFLIINILKIRKENDSKKINLLIPSMEYEKDIMQFREEILNANDDDAFAGCGSLRSCKTAEEWLANLAIQENAETCPEGSVTSNTYIAVRSSDNRIVGIIDLRHHINHPVLELWGGHMGYSVRPTERGKGYAKEILRLNLEKCKGRNMDKVMVTCSRDNVASEKTILANGGVFEKEVNVDGEIIKRYWIEL